MLKRLAVGLLLVLLVVSAVIALPLPPAEAREVWILFADASCLSGVGFYYLEIDDRTGVITQAGVGCIL